MHRPCISATTGLLVHFNYDSISYRFWDTQRQVLVFPWKLGYKIGLIEKWHHSVEHATSYQSAIVSTATSNILHYFRDIWRWRTFFTMKSMLGLTHLANLCTIAEIYRPIAIFLLLIVWVLSTFLLSLIHNKLREKLQYVPKKVRLA